MSMGLFNQRLLHLLGIVMFISASIRALTITEIYYHPLPSEGQAEFIELYNESSIPLDLGGFAFTSGIRYVFPGGTIIEPREYIVVAQSPDKLKELYGVDAFGPFEGQLDNDGDRVVLAREGGGIVKSFRYSDRDGWPVEADGFGHTLSLRAPWLDLRSASSWAPSPNTGGTPGRANGFAGEAVDEEIIPAGAAWRYFKGVTAPPAAWRDPGFDDASWKTGASGFGYGDDDDATELGDMHGSYLSVFIRISFELESTDPDQFILSISYDDGFAAWIDGKPVARNNIGPDPIPFDAIATRSHEATNPEEFNITSVVEDLEPGLHVLAVEGHNRSLSSSDFSLEPALIARTIPEPGGSPLDLVINEVLPAGLGDGWIELFNRGRDLIDMSGMTIAGKRGGPDFYVMPPGTVISPGEFHVVDGAELPFLLEPAGEDNGGAAGGGGGGAAGGGDGTGDLVVYIANAVGDRVLDAFSCENIPVGKTRGRYPDGADQWFDLDEPTRGDANHVQLEKSVVINEIMYHPTGDYDPFDPQSERPDAREYIELYNRGTGPVDLSGWRFSCGVSYLFPEGVFLGPGSYLVVAKNPQRIAELYGLETILGPYDGVLSNEGEIVRLVDAAGNTADEVHYRDGGEWDEWADGGGSSLELVDPRSDNNSASAYLASDESRSAPWTKVEYTSSHTGTESEIQMWLLGKGTVLVDNLKVSSSGTDYYWDDFESGKRNWMFRGNHQDSVLTHEDSFEGTTALRIEAAGRGEQRWNYVETDTTRSIVAGRSYTISYWGRWIRGMPVLLSRQHGHGLAKAVHLEVPLNLGTPGKKNSRFKSNSGPVVDALVQKPVLPLPTEDVDVRVRVADPDGVASVTLFYRDQGAGSFQTVIMADDGNHAEGDENDDIYGGRIPHFSDGVRVEFYIEAEDTLGVKTVFPRAGPCLYIVAASTQHDVTQCRLVMTDNTYNELRTRPIMSNYLLPASFVLGNEAIYHNVKFRYRGSPYIRPHQPQGHRVLFPSDNPFRGCITHLNLDSQVQDSTRQHERTVYYMMRKIGVSRADTHMPYSMDDFIGLWRNGTRLALYEVVERVDDNYDKAWWPGEEEGCLLKVNVQTEFSDNGSFKLVKLASLQYSGEDKESYRLLYNMFSHEELDDYDPLIELCRTINSTIGTKLEDAVNERVFMRQWADEIAVRLYVSDWDTFGVHNGHNIYLYLPQQSKKWEMIPWDADLTFGDVNAQVDIGGEFPALRKIFLRPVFSRFLRSAYWRLVNDVAQPARIGAEMDRVYNVIRTEGASSPVSIKNFLSQRAVVINNMIPHGEFRITTNNGKDFEADDVKVQVRGNAPITVEYVTVNDKPAGESFGWVSSQSWKLETELTGAENQLTFRAYDDKGEIVGEASITITAPPLPLTIASVEPGEGASGGGTLVTILGTGFEEDAFVLFMGTISHDVTFVSSSEIRAVAPPSPIGPMVADVAVENSNGKTAILPAAFEYVSGQPFIRGDANRNSNVDLADAITILVYLFSNKELVCLDAADTNDDGTLNIGDPIFLLEYLFSGGSPMTEPFPGPGDDPTQDGLSCEE